MKNFWLNREDIWKVYIPEEDDRTALNHAIVVFQVRHPDTFFDIDQTGDANCLEIRLGKRWFKRFFAFLLLLDFNAKPLPNSEYEHLYRS